jgi:hypothetical protein
MISRALGEGNGLTEDTPAAFRDSATGVLGHFRDRASRE